MPLPTKFKPVIAGSPEQQAFANAVHALRPGEACAARACAGTGKTFSLELALRGLAGSVLILVFNKRGQEELSARIRAANVRIQTIDAFAGGIVRGAYPGIKYPDFKKTRGHMEDQRSAAFVRNPRLRYPIETAVDLAMNLGVGLPGGPPVTSGTFASIFQDYGIRVPKGTVNERLGVDAMRVFQALVNDDRSFHFTDCVYHVARTGIPDNIKYDYVFVDEFQDLNVTQFLLLDQMLSRGSRLVFVGDPAQAIYGWRGAGTNSFHLGVSRYKAAVYPMTVTRRCPRAVVFEAARLVPEIRPLDTAPEGEILHVDDEATLLDVLAEAASNAEEEGDCAVICRNNAPLVEIALKCVRRRIPVCVLGRNIARDATYIVEQVFRNCPTAVRQPSPWAEARQKVRDELQDRPFALEAEMEKIDIAYALAGHALERPEIRDVAALLGAMVEVCGELLVDDPKPGTVICATVHKAKGLEWDNVIFYRPEMIPSRAAAKAGGWHVVQERNLFYVAVTRAKRRLIYSTKSDDPCGRLVEVGA